MKTLKDHAVEIACAFINNPTMFGLDGKSLNVGNLGIATAIAKAIHDECDKLDKAERTTAVENSVHDDHIVCLDCGAKLQMLKRHLTSVHNLTVAQYKEKHGLCFDYPIVAPNYAKKRSGIAKNIKHK